MFQRRFLGIGAVTVAALVVTACGSVQTEKKGGAQGGVASQLLSSAARVAESVVSGLPVTATEAKPEPPAPVEEVERRSVRRPRPAPAPAVQAPVEAAPVATADTTAGEPDPATVEPAPVAEEFVEEILSEPVVPDFTVYSAADPDVVPPTPPVASGLRPWRSGADPGPSVEVTVAGDGTVEKVQAFGRARLIDAVMLSHIKAWKFEPALRAGEPVRYRVLLHDPILAP